ncbi:unnamed protein product [marine sediment metagenome]|uniref:Uncharacterized protein n=1 Tax=marine sediment metagenome TaxID=412755 RepID=X1EW85_9ZZZZ
MVVNAKFKMKNYTTDISAERSILEIEKLLTLFGAETVIKKYTAEGRVDSLMFQLQEEAFKLPANIKGVEEVLYKSSRSAHSGDGEKRRVERSYRVAWRIIKDWTHAQLSLIASGQAQPKEIFLGYMFDGKRTLFQKYEADKLLAQKAGMDRQF